MREKEKERQTKINMYAPGVMRVMMELVYSYLSALMAASMEELTLSRSMTSRSSSLSFCNVFFASWKRCVGWRGAEGGRGVT